MFLVLVSFACLKIVLICGIYIPSSNVNEKPLASLGIKTIGWQDASTASASKSIIIHQNYSNVNLQQHADAKNLESVYEGNRNRDFGQQVLTDFDQLGQQSEDLGQVTDDFSQHSHHSFHTNNNEHVGQVEVSQKYNDYSQQASNNFEHQSQISNFDQQADNNFQIKDAARPLKLISSPQVTSSSSNRYPKQYNHEENYKPQNYYSGRQQTTNKNTQVYSKCPPGETGQFVYELSCNQFLNCYKGRGHAQNCAPGTLFNPKTLECDFVDKVECVTGPKNVRLNQASISDKIQATCPKGFTGIIPHYKDCSKFINCANGVEYNMDCAPGTLFNTKTNICDYPQKCECVNGDNGMIYLNNQSGNQGVVPSGSYLHGSSSNVHQQNANRQGNQRQDFTSGQGYHQNVGQMNRPTSVNEGKQFSSHTHANQQHNEGSHSGYQNAFDQQSSLNKQSGNHQTTKGTTGQIRQWSQNQQFPKTTNTNSYVSTHHQSQASQNERPKCPPNYTGLHEHPFDCKKFLNCNNGGTFIQDCAPGTLYNSTGKFCDFPYNVNCDKSPRNQNYKTSIHQGSTSTSNIDQYSGTHGQHFHQHTNSSNFDQHSGTHGQQFHQHAHPSNLDQHSGTKDQHFHQHSNSSNFNQHFGPHGQHYHQHAHPSNLDQHSTNSDNFHQHSGTNGQHSHQHTNSSNFDQHSGTHGQNFHQHTHPSNLDQHSGSQGQHFHQHGHPSNFDHHSGTHSQHFHQHARPSNVDQYSGTNGHQSGWANHHKHNHTQHGYNQASNQNNYNTFGNRDDKKIDNDFKAIQANSGTIEHLTNRPPHWMTTNPKSSVDNFGQQTTKGKQWPPPFPSTDLNADYVFEFDDLNVMLEPDFIPSTPTAGPRVNNWCDAKGFECGNKVCISPSAICDGKKDCPNGRDEGDCENALNQFSNIMHTKLAVKEVDKIMNITLQWCAKNCVEQKRLHCVSFNYRKHDGTCFLLSKNVGMTGALIILPNYDYYEHKAFMIDGSQGYICQNQKCINNSQICDGKNDCGDWGDEKGCKAEDFGYKVRLAGSKENNTGRIEVQAFGKTGYICDDMFGLRNADVVCRELGFQLGALEVKGNSVFAADIVENDTFYMMDDVICLGNETTLRDCDFSGWGIHNCRPQEIVGVVCKTPLETCPEGHWQCTSGKECLQLTFVCDGVVDCSDTSDENPKLCESSVEIRLSNGTSNLEGRVEIKYHGIWGTVCDDDFNDDAAKVVCSQLGFQGSGIVMKGGYFGPGNGPIWLDQVFCTGNESKLANCVHWDWGEHNCDHNEDVGVICSYHEIPGKPRHIDLDQEEEPETELLPKVCGYRKDAIFLEESDVHFRVVKGSLAKHGEYPWQASIRVKGKTKSSHWCGAVVISKKFVLTAAHCLVGFSKGAYTVVAGDYNVNEVEGTEQEAFIEDFQLHEEFRQGNKMNNDIALIRLKGAGFKFTDGVKPICLPEASFNKEQATNCTISGFGSIESGKSRASHDLRAGWIPIQSLEICKMPHIYGNSITAGMLCAGSLDEGVDACDGDSGGPLACLHEGVFTLFGLTSWGQHCGYANKPGVYVKVSHYRDWIEKTMRKLL